MRFDYWTIRVTPHPMGITTLGVGVVVVDPKTTASVFRLHNRIPKVLDNQDCSAISNALAQLEKDLRQLTKGEPRLSLDGNLTMEGYLSIAGDHWSNLIRIDQPRTMDADSLDEAADLIFQVVVGSPLPKQRKPDVRHLRQAVRKQYHSFPGLRDATLTDAKVTLQRHTLDLDLAVVNEGTILELNQAFNFQATDFKAIEKTIETWSLKIEKLRNHGGVFITPQEQLDLPANVPIVTVVESPQNYSQEKVYEDFRTYCMDLSVEILTQKSLTHHAEELERSLAA